MQNKMKNRHWENVHPLPPPTGIQMQKYDSANNNQKKERARGRRAFMPSCSSRPAGNVGVSLPDLQ